MARETSGTKTTAKGAKKAPRAVGKRSKKIREPKTGRPTKYNPRWAEKLPEMFRQGQSVLEVAVELGISRDSMYEYAKLYPVFSDALSRGKEISQAWWERMGRENLFDTTDFDPKTGKPTSRKAIVDRLWAKNMACRFREDWTEKSEVDANVHTDEGLTVVLSGVNPSEPKK